MNFFIPFIDNEEFIILVGTAPLQGCEVDLTKSCGSLRVRKEKAFQEFKNLYNK